jgi:hypothetical protein
MKKQAIKIIAFLSLFAAISCSPELRPFTSNILQEGGWSDTDLQKIQFYLSDDIIIRRQLTEGTSEITSGTIKIVNGQKLEEVRIKKGTPGTFLFRAVKNNFAVGFDANSDKRYLMFGANPKKQGSYVLLASEWKDRMGKVQYDNRFYFAEEESAWASLLVDLKKINKVEVDSRTEGGRKVSQ